MDKSLEIMRILRVPPLGKLVVELGGKQYSRWEDVPDGRARQLVLAALGELVAFGGGYQKLVEAGFAPPIMPPAPVVKQDEALTPAQAAFLESLRSKDMATAVTADPVQLVRQLAEQERQVAPAAVAPAPPPPPAPTPIPAPPPAPPANDPIGQLNAILQKHLAQAPELNGQQIYLAARDGGVQLNVNGTFYAKPSEVPDPLIRMIVKTARQEWADGKRE